MAKLSQYIGQAVAYALFAMVIGYFATQPSYTYLEPGKAQIKLSFGHAGAHTTDCRRLSQEELNQLAPNMRRPLDCPRGRLPVLIELELDGELLYRGELPPSGLAGDGVSTAYQKFAVDPGQHQLVARLRDSNRSEGFDYEKASGITLSPQQNFVVDFHPSRGGFQFL
ncbi:MAG: hypothetical protein WBN81_16600 [Gammaproteobacteria bacterium]